ncbi:Hpt domain-containing protein [Paenibacillus sp. YYML68]|uniref:Hpt domain-containing protein n=1 Tax=Paenibacillus sp. YYML68 TaxID=2909250 RepID=UPI0024901334|nr:Hpt domain-containing protein [Paenibacillus sp. YYML68]
MNESLENVNRYMVTIDADLEELVPGYLTNRAADYRNMTSALKQADYDHIRAISHSMKGSGGGYGFDELTEIGSLLEQHAIAADYNGIAATLHRLQDYLAKVVVRYEA